MKFKVYYIKDDNGRGLHFRCGNQYWNPPDNGWEVMEYTRFGSIREALGFMHEKNIKAFIGEYTIKVEE